jgi:sulfane dehydrogenase subunit SoxC
MVDRPLILTMEEILRLPQVSRIHFIECSGNSVSEWATPRPNAQGSHGMVGGSEWTGVPLSLLLSEVGVQDGARWIVCEGADACRMHRSIPMEKAIDDIILAYGQNGEAIRPEQGYPLRLVVPGWEGNTHIKWLTRLMVVDQPYMARDETSKYTDLMPDGTARQFTFTMEAKSVITFPSGRKRLAGPGIYQISGLAWSGRGLVESVEISTDGGRSWLEAQLQEPRHPISLTRFRLPWQWDGREVTLQSRCIDETGYIQPSREQLIEVRGLNTRYHYNGIMVWKVLADGSVENAYA